MKNLLILLLLCNTASATSYSWYKSAGNWNNANNWRPAGVPKGLDNVIISNTQANITIDTVARCNSITLDSAAMITFACPLTVGNLTLYGNLICSGPATVFIKGMLSFGFNTALVINNKAVCTGGITMGGDSLNTITNNGVFTVSGQFVYGYRSAFINNGTVHLANAVISGPVGSFVFKNSGVMMITGGAVDLQTN